MRGFSKPKIAFAREIPHSIPSSAAEDTAVGGFTVEAINN